MMDTWPFNTRIARDVARELGIEFTEEDNGGGYLFSLKASGQLLFSGSGSIASYPINSSTAASISKDKLFTHRIASRFNIPTIESRLYFLSSFYSGARAPGREKDDLFKYARNIDFPLFAKPNKGSRGDFAEVISTRAGLQDYVQRASKRHDQILIQPVLNGSEVRVFVIDDRCLYQYYRKPAKLFGDGVNTWFEILSTHNEWLHSVGLSTVSIDHLKSDLELLNVSLDAVSQVDMHIPLTGRRNISANNKPERFSKVVDPAFEEIALKITRGIGLRVAGVDMLIAPGKDQDSIASPKLLEVNGNPSIDSLEALGEIELAKAIWRTIITEWIKETVDETFFT